MAGVTAFTYAFNERQLVPSERFQWDDYEARLFRYALAEAYYNNTAYRDIETFSGVLKKRYDLYKHTRGVYNPVYRQNELIKAKLAGGTLDWEKLQRGALQIGGADEPLIEALIQVLKWSNWGVNKSLFVHQGALLGDSLLWVVDDRARQKVRLEVVHPSKIKECDFDDVGHVKRIVLEYQREWKAEPGAKPKDVVYTLTADEHQFVTLKDGEEFGWHLDMNGKPVSRWPNEYGFITGVVAHYKKVGQRWGANAFHAEIHKINEVNDTASLLNDSMRKVIDPWWYLAGTQASTTLKPDMRLSDGTATTDPSAQRDKIKTLHGPQDSQPYPMVLPIDITAAGQQIQDLLMELERDMPELAMHRLRENGGDKSGIAIRNSYSDATGRLNEGAGNLDDALIRALQMCASIGGFRGYAHCEGFDLNSFASGTLDFYIKERSFFEDGFTPQEKVSNLKSLPDNPAAAKLALEEMQYTPEQIELVLKAMLLKQQQDAMQPQGQPGQGGPVNVQPNPRPQLPAGQGDEDATAEVNAFLASIGVTA